jgi:hypothetical protein
MEEFIKMKMEKVPIAEFVKTKKGYHVYKAGDMLFAIRNDEGSDEEVFGGKVKKVKIEPEKKKKKKQSSKQKEWMDYVRKIHNKPEFKNKSWAFAMQEASKRRKNKKPK